MKRMQKSVIAMLMILSFLVSLCACGGNADEDETTTAAEAETTTAASSDDSGEGDSDDVISLNSWDGVNVTSAGAKTGAATVVGSGISVVYDESLGSNVLEFTGNGYLELPSEIFSETVIDGFTVGFRVKTTEETDAASGIFEANLSGYGSGDTYWRDAGELCIKADLTTRIYVGGRTINGTYTAASTYNNGISGVDDSAYAEPNGYKPRYSASTDASLSTETWIDVVLTVSSEEFAVYVDGAPVAMSDDDDTFDLTSTLEYLFTTELWEDGSNLLNDYLFVCIGNSVYSDEPYFIGSVDDVTILLGAVSETEVESVIGSADADYLYTFSNDSIVMDAASVGSDLSMHNGTTAVTRVDALTVTSPDGEIQVDFYTDADGGYYYSVTSGDTVVIEVSALGFEIDGYNFADGLEADTEQVTVTEVNESFDMFTGASSTNTDHCNEEVIPFTTADGTFRLVVRAYDDGMAYRYEDVTVSDGEDSVTVLSELSEVDLPDSADTWAFELNGTYEGEYVERSHSQLTKISMKLSTPVLAQVEDTYVLLTEAAVYNNDGEYCSSALMTGEVLTWSFGLARDPDNEATGDLVSPGHIDIETVETVNGFSTPWRVAIISDDMDEFVTSNLVAALNPDPDEEVYADTSWIQPGVVAWSWWAEDSSQGDYDKHVEYIDLAAENGWEYVCLDAGWRDFEDRLSELCDYAAEKGIGIFVWVNYRDIKDPDDMEELFSAWSAAGAVGLKTDYYESDEAEVLYVMQEVALTAAEYQLMVLYHGCINPGGESRTYPNVLSYEAVQGEEWHKWFSYPTVENCLMYPFTRNITGPMDYTPLATPSGNGETAAFALAKTVVYETGLMHMANAAVNYQKFNGISLINHMPVTWDDTTVYEGTPGEFISLMRQSGDEYYIGAMTLEATTVTYDLSFLGDGTYNAYIYADDSNGSALVISSQEVTASSTLSFDLLEDGGIVIMITKDEVDLTAGGTVDISANYTWYEAESSDNTLSGTAVTATAALCSGGQKVGYVGNGTANTLTFNEITVDADGTYEIMLEYCSGEDRTVYVSVNGGEEVAVETPSTGSYTIAGSVTFTVELTAGSNTITLGNSSYYAPDIDRIGVGE